MDGVSAQLAFLAGQLMHEAAMKPLHQRGELTRAALVLGHMRRTLDTQPALVVSAYIEAVLDLITRAASSRIITKEPTR